MGPELLGALGILGCVVLILGAFIWAFFLGQGSEKPNTKLESARADRAEEALEQYKAQAKALAEGNALDMERVTDLAGAAAAGDLSGVLDQFPDDDGAPTIEQGNEADSEDAPGADA